MLSLTGKNALVTGGSRGIGRATCALFGRLGARVAVAYARDEAAARHAVEEVEAAGSRAVALRTDLARDGEAERLVAAAEDALGALDVLVANHGIWKRAPIESMTAADWDETLRVNLTSVRALSGGVLVKPAPISDMFQYSITPTLQYFNFIALGDLDYGFQIDQGS